MEIEYRLYQITAYGKQLWLFASVHGTQYWEFTNSLITMLIMENMIKVVTNFQGVRMN